MALLYGRAGRLTALFGGFWPGQIMSYLPPANLTVMDQIKAAGLHVMFAMDKTYFTGVKRAAEESFVRSQLRKFKSHPALL